MISVTLADDHSLVRIGIRKILEAAPNIKVLAESSDGKAALDAVLEFQPDIAILDIAMPEMSGLQVATELVQQRSRTRAIIVSMHADSEYAREAQRAGASGYVPKSCAPEEIYLAVRKVHSGGTYFGKLLARAPVESRHAVPHSSVDHAHLSARQRQVLELIGQGHSMAEIAEVLGIGVKTAETHRHRLMQQLGLRNSRELMRFAVRNSPTAR